MRRTSECCCFGEGHSDDRGNLEGLHWRGYHQSSAGPVYLRGFSLHSSGPDQPRLSGQTPNSPTTALTIRVAKEAARVFTMLPSTPQVESVYLGDTGLLKGLSDVQSSGSLSEHVKANPWLLGASAAPSGTTNANTLLVDHTTLDPTAAKRVADDVHAKTNNSALMIDGPVSGGEWGLACWASNCQAVVCSCRGCSLIASRSQSDLMRRHPRSLS